MNSYSRFAKNINTDIGGAPFSEAAPLPELPDNLLSEETDASELYPDFVPPPLPKKHSADFVHNRFKARQIAEKKLTRLSEELFKIAEEVRYYHPVMAELLDEAWDATEEALTLVQDDE